MERHDTVGERRKGYLTDRRALRKAVWNSSKVRDGEPIHDTAATAESVVGSTVLER